MLRYSPFLLISVIFLIGSCKGDRKLPEKDYTGLYIKSIISDVVELENGEKIFLDSDSLSKIFYLIRHAEKDTSVKENPPLTEEGLLRGARLADIMKGTRVDAIYSTFFIRTLYTVDSLADIKGMKVQAYDNKMLKELLNEIKENNDLKSVLFVGHSNNIPSITNTLSGRDVYTQAFDELDYDNFAVVLQFKDGTTKTYPLRYK